MTIKELAMKHSGSANMEIVKDGEVVLVFDCEYWKYIVDEILNLQVDNFTIRTEILAKNTVVVSISENGDVPNDEGEPEGITDDELDAICK